ncbi:MAG: class I SAM-dependent methyltransferase [Limisphaerales bacterium]
MKTEPNVSEVKSFWNTEACGTHFVEQAADEKDFFEKFRAFRYRTEWHIPLLVPFAESRGKQVLEIGTGNGADGVMFASHGAQYTGVDLTEAALEATRRHFAVMGLTGRFQRENAEHLSFDDGSFDWVFSHGVLHHTPNTQAAINEVYRVLKPGGRAIIMLYHKHSFNYYIRIMTYMRLRVLFKVLSRTGRWSRDRQAAANTLQGLRGNQDRQVWSIHYQNFLREGWRYLRAGNFVHHCTDGPECPVAYAFTRAEATALFSNFRHVRTTVAHLPLKKYYRGIPFGLEKFLARRMGWYLFIFADKQPVRT